ncbi:DMT family transporter [Terasakiella sp. SH-1]|uniref:DMT family transporter n=1 Tax=Terasakiella sp. SH-1 TaxID=2560057 RepID=UPI00107402C5|nr:DMT family transporter [Terasakiella sp. SH-1]
MSRLRANLLLLITAIIWGTAFVAQHTSMGVIGPYYFTALRFLLGGLVIVPLALREYQKRKESGVPLSQRHWLGMVLCGVFLFTASITQQVGIADTSVTNAGFLTGLYVPLVPLMLLIFWRKLPHWSIWPAAFGCLIGTYYLSGGNFSSFNNGDFWMMVSAIFWALQIITVGFVVRSSDTPIILACTQFLCCSVFATVGALGLETISWAAIQGAGFEIFYAGVMSIGIAFTLQAVAQRHTGQADAAIIMSGEVLFAAIAGALLLGERLTIEGYMGALIMFMSILSVEVLPLLRRKQA